MAQDRVGQKKETVECRPLIVVSLPTKFEVVEINLAPDEAAHYHKTVRRDESGRSKKKRKKIALSQVGLSGRLVGESKADIKI